MDEPILDLPLFWAWAATLRDPAAIDVDGVSAPLPAGTVLAQQVLVDGSGGALTAYCTPRRAAERATDSGLLAAPLFRLTVRPILRSTTDRQLCLIDGDGDGRADQGVVVGDGSPAARTPHDIAPVRLDIDDLVPISGQDRVRIVLTRLARRGNSAEFTLQIEQQGHARVFETIAGPWGSSTIVTRVRTGTLPVAVSIMGAEFSILSVDPVARTVRIAWPEGADENLVAVVPDQLRIVYR